METRNTKIVDDRLPCHRDLPTRPVGQEVLVREPDTGNVHFLNATSALIWNCCDGQTTVQECVHRLREAFDIPAEADPAADIHEIIADLTERGLFEKGSESA